jgi:hypothetical protein
MLWFIECIVLMGKLLGKWRVGISTSIDQQFIPKSLLRCSRSLLVTLFLPS